MQRNRNNSNGGNINGMNGSNNNDGPTREQKSNWPWNHRRWDLLPNGKVSYCHTHGHDTGAHNTSMMCSRRGTNYNCVTTSKNTLGGNPAGSEHTVNPRSIGLIQWKLPSNNNWLQQTMQ